MVLNNSKEDKLLHQSLSKHPVGFTMYNDVHVGHQLEILLLLVATLLIPHVGNIPQDHDPTFIVASMLKQMQNICVSFPWYIATWPGWE